MNYYNEIKKELKEKLLDLKKFYKEEKNPILVTGKMLKTAEINDIVSAQQILKRNEEKIVKG